MNKNELIAEVAVKTAKTKRETENTITATLDVIAETLSREEPIKIMGFGQFYVKKRAPRIGRNPKTNEEIKIKETVRPAFKPGQMLIDIVDGRS